MPNHLISDRVIALPGICIVVVVISVDKCIVYYLQSGGSNIPPFFLTGESARVASWPAGKLVRWITAAAAAPAAAANDAI